MPRLRVGTDIGGTFTDLCVLDEEQGEFINLKVPTTPKDLTEGVLEALEAFFRDGRSRRREPPLPRHHGATNALLEQKGANTWLVISEGYTGVYETPELGEIRVGSYDYLSYPKPRSLSPSAKPSRSPSGWAPMEKCFVRLMSSRRAAACRVSRTPAPTPWPYASSSPS